MLWSLTIIFWFLLCVCFMRIFSFLFFCRLSSLLLVCYWQIYVFVHLYRYYHFFFRWHFYVCRILSLPFISRNGTNIWTEQHTWFLWKSQKWKCFSHQIWHFLVVYNKTYVLDDGWWNDDDDDDDCTNRQNVGEILNSCHKLCNINIFHVYLHPTWTEWAEKSTHINGKKSRAFTYFFLSRDKKKKKQDKLGALRIEIILSFHQLNAIGIFLFWIIIFFCVSSWILLQ